MGVWWWSGGAWLHPSDWRRLLPGLSSLGLASPAIGGVGSKILPNLPWKREEAEKRDTSSAYFPPPPSRPFDACLCSELASPPASIFLFWG